MPKLRSGFSSGSNDEKPPPHDLQGDERGEPEREPARLDADRPGCRGRQPDMEPGNGKDVGEREGATEGEDRYRDGRDSRRQRLPKSAPMMDVHVLSR